MTKPDPHKIQNFGLNPKVLADELRYIIEEALEDKNEDIKDYDEFIRGYREIILYGWEDMNEKRYSPHIVQIMQRYFPDMERIDDVARQYASIDPEAGKSLNLEKFDRLSEFVRADVKEVTVTEEEEAFTEEIALLLLMLQTMYTKEFLPIAFRIEQELKTFLVKMYSDNTGVESLALLETYINEQKEKLAKEFEKLGKEMLEKTGEKARNTIARIGTKQQDKDSVLAGIQIFLWSINSNIAGTLSTYFRQAQEKHHDNVKLGAVTRSLATDQVPHISINKNNYKLSLIEHAKALYRYLIFESAKDQFTHFKAVTPLFLLPQLSLYGVTRQVLYTIKTQRNWDTTYSIQNVNVINGLSLHHGDNIFYFPVSDDKQQRTIAQKQRENLTD